MSATAGSSRPLVSLISAAPASTAAAIVSARQVSIETSDARVGERLDHRAERSISCSTLIGVGVGAPGQHADVDDAGAGSDQIEPALHLLLDALEAARVGDRVPADVEDAHDDRLARAQIERRVAVAAAALVSRDRSGGTEALAAVGARADRSFDIERAGVLEHALLRVVADDPWRDARARSWSSSRCSTIRPSTRRPALADDQAVRVALAQLAPELGQGSGSRA